MKKLVALLLSLCLVLGCVAFASADGYTPGTYEATTQGFGGDVKVEITVDENAITDVKITGDSETPTVGGAALETLATQIKEKQSADIDGVAGLTSLLDSPAELSKKIEMLASLDDESYNKLVSSTEAFFTNSPLVKNAIKGHLDMFRRIIDSKTSDESA